MNSSMTIQNQLLATKFFLPTAPGALISRPRLHALLDKALMCPFTLVSAPAGFGKTTLLSTWAHSRPAHNIEICWLSLDEEDNDPYLFWTYVLSALHAQDHHFADLLSQLQSPLPPPLKPLLTRLINLLTESTHHLVLILDDYHLITKEQVHTTMAYLIEHLSSHSHIILATRADPPLPLSLLRAQQQAREIRTDQLRCTVEETKAFFQHVVGISLSDQIIREVADRTEGWLVGLHLLGLSLPEHAHPATLLEEANGQQHFILEYLTQIVLRQQTQEIQTFLLSTCILERLSASLCDAVMQQTNSQQMLQRIKQANLFVVSLDNTRKWYRYHALFAEALCYHLQQTHPDLVAILHYRASLWYAQHNQTTQAIVHAFHAQQWEWAADLIEQKSLPLMALTWGASERQLVLLQDWLKQLPAEVMGSRPYLCLACVHLLWTIAPFSLLDIWFNAAETKLTASLASLASDGGTPNLQTQQEYKDLLGEVTTWRAYQQSFYEHGEKALVLCQQALSLLSEENSIGRALVALPQLMSYYTSTANNAMASVESGLQGSSLAQSAGHTTLAIILMGITAKHMIGGGRLYEAYQLTNLAIQLGKKPAGLKLPDVGWPAAFQAEILREWNQLDAAHSLIQEALELCQQTESLGLLIYIITGYAVLLRISLSRGNLEAATSALQQAKRISMKMNQPLSLHFYSLYTTVDQVKLWLARGELDQAICWTKELDQRKRHATPFAHEREEVARAHILLAISQPTEALQRLEPILQRATAGQRWGHVIEIRLLQALAYQMLQQETQALSALSEATRLAEPEGYIRSFVDEGFPMEALLYRLRERNAKHGPTPYLDTLLTAFQQEKKADLSAEEPTKPQQLSEPLSKRELQVLQLLTEGLSNQRIAQNLVIALDTVKRHISHIFAKLDVDNRVQAMQRGRELGLLDTER